jgi:hypothetical protein
VNGNREGEGDKEVRCLGKPPTPPREPLADLPKESRGLVLLGIKVWKTYAQAFQNRFEGKISEEEFSKVYARMEEVASGLGHLTGLSKDAIIGYLSEYA